MRRALVAPLALLPLLACQAIVARPLSRAPMNSCAAFPCSAYGADGGTPTAECNEATKRCEVTTPGNRPTYPIWIVVNLPDTSFFAPGLAWVFFSDENGEPAFKRPATANPLCTPPQCLQVGGASFVSGGYQATLAATTRIAATVDDATLAAIAGIGGDQRIPVDVVFTPTGNGQTLDFGALPLQPLTTSSGKNLDPNVKAVTDYGRTLLAGTYARELYPQAPFDAVYPPTTTSIAFAAGDAPNDLVLAVAQAGTPTVGQALDFSTNQCAVDGTQQDARCAVVSREDGLAGWRVWIENATTQKRVSVVHTFTGPTPLTRAASLLYTAVGASLGDGYRAVVAPPADWLGVPRLETPLFGGTQGLQTLVVPSAPPPVTVRGVVAEPGSEGTLLGFAAEVHLESTTLTTTTGSSPLLHYTTTVSTDDRGRFATVVPPGQYTASVDPALGTGFARSTTTVLVDRDPTALVLAPTRQVAVRGRARLSDGRALAEASVLAEPSAGATGPTGRPGRTTTADDGTYVLDLDPGTYVLTVVPKAGTGFPRVLSRFTVAADAVTLADVLVPPPTRLAFTLRDPNATGNPIVRAVVRVFATAPGTTDPLEIGRGITDPDGAVEILLAERPR